MVELAIATSLPMSELMTWPAEAIWTAVEVVSSKHG
jgi:hypothetical protein